MVDSDKGITNLHVPSDVIIDASMPAMIRDSGKMWNNDGERRMPTSSFLTAATPASTQATVEFCKQNGAFDPAHHGHSPERWPDGQEGRGVWLPRQDLRNPSGRHRPRQRRKTGNVLFEHEVEEGDIWRACQTKDAPIRDWVKLAVTRARATGAPGDLLAQRGARARREPHRQGRGIPQGSRHRRSRHPHPGTGRSNPSSRLSVPRQARTPSRLPVTSCVTT